MDSYIEQAERIDDPMALERFLNHVPNSLRATVRFEVARRIAHRGQQEGVVAVRRAPPSLYTMVLRLMANPR